MLKNRGIAFKLTLLTILSTSLIFSSIFVYSYLFSKKIIHKKIRENAKNLTTAIVNHIDMVLLPLEKVPQGLVCFLEHTSYTQNDLISLLKSIVKNNPDIYGCAIAFAPYKFDKHLLYFSPYCYKSNGKIKLKYIGSDSYRYFYWDWYQLPKELGHCVWTEPYYGKGGGVIMATYAVPFYKIINGKKEFMGVVAADISLKWLQNIVESIKIGKTGYAFLISKDGRFITYPDKRFIMNETIFTVAKEYNRPYLRKIGIEMIHGCCGFVPVYSILTGKKCWLSFAPLSSSGWALGVMFPQKELMADIMSLNAHVVMLGIIGFVLLALVIVFIARSITRPLSALTDVTKDVAKGNLDIKIPYTHLGDEVGKLAQSFDFMRRSLKDYIKDLKETTAAKERIESELNIAAEIQASMLPRTFPPFPERKEFDIYAMMHPAKEVGGDFYDFFFIDENRLCFLIGDVSGKGVPAALFMAIMKYLLKTEALRGVSPNEVLNRVNQTICPDNETCMFATIFLGILDVKKGIVYFANAGHNPPLLCSKNRGVKLIDVSKGFVVGVMDEVIFESQSLTLAPGDILFLYTDGVTEAMNTDGELFSVERLITSLEDILKDTDDVTLIVKKVQDKIKDFVKNASQSDDITMVALKFKGF